MPLNPLLAEHRVTNCYTAPAGFPYHARMRSAVFALIVCFTGSLFAVGGALAQQREHGPGFKGPGKMRVDRRLPEQARGDPRDRRPERMSPQDREKLRRDIDDANRGMERRR